MTASHGRFSCVAFPASPCVQELEGRWDYQGSWQETYLAGTVPGFSAAGRKPLRVAGVQSDLLYTPWL
jgi:hypothetical protein